MVNRSCKFNLNEDCKATVNGPNDQINVGLLMRIQKDYSDIIVCEFSLYGLPLDLWEINRNCMICVRFGSTGLEEEL